MLDNEEYEFLNGPAAKIAQRLGDTSSRTNESQTIQYAVPLDQTEDGST
jgi:hypothetical protein